MRRLRPYIAVAVVTVALCADRAAQAAPMLRPEMAQFAERLVARLTVGFSRSGVNLRIFPQRRPQLMLSVATPPPRRFADLALPAGPLLSLAQLALPPPPAL